MDIRIAVLDDWQKVALRLADWSEVTRRADVAVFERHLSLDEAARELAPFHCICMLRERMAMPAQLLDRLPNLRLICTTGAKHRTLDYEAAARRGVQVVTAMGSP